MSERDAHIRKRLAELIQKDGADMKFLSEQVLGRNHAYVFQYLNQGTPKRLSDDAVAKLARHFGVDEAELLPDTKKATALRKEPGAPSAINTDALVSAIVAIRFDLRQRGAQVSIADEAQMIAALYQELLAARQP